MTKLMNYVLILVILCCGLHLSVGETLKCEFKDENYSLIGSLYTCKVTSLDNSFNNMRIDGYTGTHTIYNNDNDVKAIYIQGKNMKYIPAILGSLSNLLALLIHNSNLVEIKANDFLGIRNLEYLNLVDNKLTSLPSNVFSTLTKLKVISLPNNQIEEIPSELFSNNLNLEYVNLDKNKIKYIGSESFNRLTKLNFVDLSNNICVNKIYHGTTINDLKQEIKMNCVKPNDVIQNEIEQKIINKLNVMRTERHQEHNEMRNDRIENIKLRAERDQLMNENNDLKKELSEAKKTINEKLPKMEQTINEFHMEVMDQKIERHHQRELYRGIRSKLMEANERLAKSQINERSLI